MKSTLNGKTLCEYLSPLYKSISYPVAQDKSKEIWEQWETDGRQGGIKGEKEKKVKESVTDKEGKRPWWELELLNWGWKVVTVTPIHNYNYTDLYNKIR